MTPDRFPRAANRTRRRHHLLPSVRAANQQPIMAKFCIMVVALPLAFGWVMPVPGRSVTRLRGESEPGPEEQIRQANRDRAEAEAREMDELLGIKPPAGGRGGGGRGGRRQPSRFAEMMDKAARNAASDDSEVNDAMRAAFGEQKFAFDPDEEEDPPKAKT